MVVNIAVSVRKRVGPLGHKGAPTRGAVVPVGLLASADTQTTVADGLAQAPRPRPSVGLVPRVGVHVIGRLPTVPNVDIVPLGPSDRGGKEARRFPPPATTYVAGDMEQETPGRLPALARPTEKRRGHVVRQGGPIAVPRRDGLTGIAVHVPAHVAVLVDALDVSPALFTPRRLGHAVFPVRVLGLARLRPSETGRP